MTEFGDRIATIVVRATSPDHGVHAEVRGRDEVQIRLAPGAYRSYTESALAHQLCQVGALLWTRHRRAYLETMEDYLGDLVDEGYENANQREYWQRLEQLPVTGTSARQYLTLRSRALVSWEVELAPGTIRALRETEFLDELSSAVRAALADYRARVTLLTDELLDLGVPRGRRAGTQGGRRS
jgi:hypothetical protein